MHGKRRKYPDDGTKKIFEAAKSGDVVVLCEVLQQMKINERASALEPKTTYDRMRGVETSKSKTPLIVAARHGRRGCVKVLMKFKADIEIRGDDYYSDEVCAAALAAAVTNGHVDVVRCLVQNGADVNTRTNDDCTPLMIACKYGQLSVVTFLVEHGAIMDLQDKDGKTALHYAVHFEHVSRNVVMNIVTFLVEQGADMDLQDKEGATALHYAFYENIYVTGQK